MILASAHQVPHDATIAKMEIYNPMTPNADFDEIGWRASESYFCIILSYVDLMSLRGEKIYEDFE